MTTSAKDLLNGIYPNVWIRLPTRGQCPYTGLSRGTFYNLIHRGAIKSASLRQPGQLTGTRLVWLPSVFDLLNRCVEKHGKSNQSETPA